MKYCSNCGEKISADASFCSNCGKSGSGTTIRKNDADNQSIKNVSGGSNSLIIIGVILLFIGIFSGAFTTSQSHLWGLYSTNSTPYQSYMIPLLIGGIVLIIVGAVMKGSKK